MQIATAPHLTFSPSMGLSVRRAGAQSGTTACLLLCLSLIDVASIAASETLFRGLITSVTATAIFLPLIVRTLKQPIDIFEPIIPAMTAFLSMFVLRPVLDQISSNYVHLGFNISAHFDEALLVVMAGCISFAAGYLSNLKLFLGRGPRNPVFKFPLERVVRAAIVTAVLGIGLFALFLLSTGGVSTLALLLRGRSGALDRLYRHSTSYLYGGVTLVIPASFMFFAAWLRSRSKGHLIAAFLVLTPVLTIGVAQGTRITLLPVVTGLAAIYYLFRRRRPRLINIVIAGAIALAASSLLREFRDSSSARQIAAQSEFTRDPAGQLAETFSNDDNEMFDTIANSLSVVPSRIPYRPWAIVIDLVNRMIPRTLYPEKPLEANDQLIVLLWPQHYARSRASAASSIFGNFYIYGGIVEVCIGAWVVGVILDQLWKWQLRNPTNMNVIVLYALVPSLVLILLRGTIIDTLSRMIYTVLPLLVAQRYWRRA